MSGASLMESFFSSIDIDLRLKQLRESGSAEDIRAFWDECLHLSHGVDLIAEFWTMFLRASFDPEYAQTFCDDAQADYYLRTKKNPTPVTNDQLKKFKETLARKMREKMLLEMKRDWDAGTPEQAEIFYQAGQEAGIENAHMAAKTFATFDSLTNSFKFGSQASTQCQVLIPIQLLTEGQEREFHFQDYLERRSTDIPSGHSQPLHDVRSLG